MSKENQIRPIDAAANLGSLVDLVLGPTMHLKGQARKRAMLGLAAPAAVARWIARFRPHLAHQERVGLIVAGAEWVDALDDGKFWSYLGVMLGNPELKVGGALVGPNLQLKNSGLSIKAPRSLRAHTHTLGHFLREESLENFDLVVLPHPGMEVHAEEWMSDGGLLEVISAGVPVAVISFSEQERHMDAAFLDVFGVQATTGEINPFKLPNAGKLEFDGLQWLWSIKGPIQPRDPAWQAKRLEHITVCVQRLGALIAREVPAGIAPTEERDIGSSRLNQSSLGYDDLYIKLVRDMWVRQRDGQVYRVDKNDFAEKQGVSVPQDRLDTYPGPDAAWLDKAIWATSCWSEVVEPHLNNRLFKSPMPGNLGMMSMRGEEHQESLRSIFEGAGIDPSAAQSMFDALGGKAPRRMTPDERRLFDVIEKRREDQALSLLEAAPRLVSATTDEHSTVMHEAINTGMSRLLRRVVELGGDRNAPDGEGWTPVCHAASIGAEDALDLLIQFHADIDKPTPLGWAPVMIAITHRKWGCVVKLARAGCDLDAQNIHRMNARQFAEVHQAPDFVLNALAA